MQTHRGKDFAIETLRGIAIILMVAGHVVGARATDGMQVPEGSAWHLVFWGLQDFRMPLFTVLSGFVYAARPARDWPQYGSLARAKVRRVLIPLLVVGTLVFWAKLLNPVSRSGVELGDWWTVYVFGMDHLWFLQAIFLLFLIVGVLDVLGTLDKRTGWIATSAISVLLYVTAIVPNLDLLGIGAAVRLLPFFLLGYGLKRFAPELPKPWLWALILVLGAAFTPRLLALNGVIAIDSIHLNRALGVLIGMSAIIALWHVREALTNRRLAWLGGYAFGIYLFHYFALQAVWFGSRAIGLENEFVKFGLGMILGLGCPILLHKLTSRLRWARLLLFGEKLAATKRVVLADPAQHDPQSRIPNPHK